jgi:hypothetical protein
LHLCNKVRRSICSAPNISFGGNQRCGDRARALAVTQNTFGGRGGHLPSIVIERAIRKLMYLEDSKGSRASIHENCLGRYNSDIKAK